MFVFQDKKAAQRASEKLKRLNDKHRRENESLMQKRRALSILVPDRDRDDGE